MRTVVALAFVVGLVACGGGQPRAAYTVPKAIECLRQTNSVLVQADDAGIFFVLTSADSVSANEPVVVGFRNGEVARMRKGRVAAILTAQKPSWAEKRGDAEVQGFGPYVTPAARRPGVSHSDAATQARQLALTARGAVETCLKQSER